LFLRESLPGSAMPWWRKPASSTRSWPRFCATPRWRPARPGQL